MKEIQLTRGKSAKVDDDVFEELRRHRWCTLRTTSALHYAVRAYLGEDGNWHQARMHRIIWEMYRGPIPDGMQIDHVSGDSLDNRLENLRLCTQAQNNAHQRPQLKKADAHSQYKGVTWNIKARRWQAQIQRDYEHRRIGFFDSENEAAKAYDKEARELFGEFAWTNFPKEVRIHVDR